MIRIQKCRSYKHFSIPGTKEFFSDMYPEHVITIPSGTYVAMQRETMCKCTPDIVEKKRQQITKNEQKYTILRKNVS